ncbi:MAG: anti-sigma factor, partial [Bacteroides sp.]
MSYTNTELEQLLNRLVASTRTPRGRFAAAESYKLLEKQLPRKRSLRLIRWAGAAAAMVALCVAGFFMADYTQGDSPQTIYTQAEVRTISLPDGTEVTLNHFSSLTYPKRFQQKERTVSLCG